MKKKIIAGVIIALFVSVIISLFFVRTSSPEKVKYGGKWSFDEATGVLTVSGDVKMKQEEYIGYHAPWRENIEKITSVIFQEGVTTIGEDAFFNYGNLQSVTLPSTVTKISKKAFHGCSNIKEVRITDLKSWCNITFEDEFSSPLCSGATLYLNNEPLTDLIIPEEIENINYYTFMGCESLKSVTIPSGIMYIGDCAFMNCENLESVSVPEAVTSLGICTFQGCKKLKSINVPESIRIINYGVFSGCESLESITLPDGLRTIGWWAFESCKSLKSINIPESVTYIDDTAFMDCDSIFGIKYPNIQTVYNDDISINYDGIEGFFNERKMHYNSKNELVDAGYEITGAVKVKNGTTAILLCAFDVGNISSVILPDSVTDIDDCAFYCSHISYIKIPDGVTNIGEEAFMSCRNLKSITIPPSVKTIGNKAIGYVFGDYDDLRARDVKAEDFIIRGVAGSEAEKYAKENGIKFVACTEQELNETCSCLCHKTGIAKLFWKIDSFFMEKLGLGQDCKCSGQHYSNLK